MCASDRADGDVCLEAAGPPKGRDPVEEETTNSNSVADAAVKALLGRTVRIGAEELEDLGDELGPEEGPVETAARAVVEGALLRGDFYVVPLPLVVKLYIELKAAAAEGLDR